MTRTTRSILAAAAVSFLGAALQAQGDLGLDRALQPEPPKQDRYLVKLPPREVVEGSPTPRSGRVILFFLRDDARAAEREPMDGPFFERLQPIASVSLEGVSDDLLVIDDRNATVFGGPLDLLDGAWRVQAVLDQDFTERGFRGPGNRASEPTAIDRAPDSAEETVLELTRTIADESPPAHPKVEWIERRSALLSAHFRREVVMRAGIVRPFGYDDLSFPRRMWPTVYVVPGFGGTREMAAQQADGLASRSARDAVPQAVWVFLDAETPWGHHGFCDSETNGPVGRALVEEFIPFLEERMRLVAKPEARLVTGHSSGGWTAIHLALAYPDTFGACFASAPGPVDFTAFQRTDLYRDKSFFTGKDGAETPSYRGILGPNDDRVFMTVRDEMATERALDPDGRSGQQWDAWEAMWSPFDPARNAPRPICDPETGDIDLVVAEEWTRHDIARRVERDGGRTARLVAERVRLLCGTRDSFYLNEAVARLKAKVEAWQARERAAGRAAPAGPGFIELVEGHDHGSITPLARIRFHQEMLAHLRAHGLADRAPSAAPEETGLPGAEPVSPPVRDARPAEQPRERAQGL